MNEVCLKKSIENGARACPVSAFAIPLKLQSQPLNVAESMNTFQFSFNSVLVHPLTFGPNFFFY